MVDTILMGRAVSPVGCVTLATLTFLSPGSQPSLSPLHGHVGMSARTVARPPGFSKLPGDSDQQPVPRPAGGLQGF